MKIHNFIFIFLITTSVSAAENPIQSDGFILEKLPSAVHLENFIVKTMDPLGKIVGSYIQAQYLQPDDIVYISLKKEGVSPGDRFLIYENLGAIRESGFIFRKKMGEHIRIKGRLEVRKIKNSTIEAKILETYQPVSIDDLLTSEINLNIPVKLQEPKVALTGHILQSSEKASLIGAYEFAFIDKGSQDGLQLNDRLYVVRTDGGSMKINKERPDIPIAELVIVHMDEKAATAYCLSSTEAFEAGSTFRAMQSEIRYLDDEK